MRHLQCSPPSHGGIRCQVWMSVSAFSTLERWYYAARRANDPVAALKDRLRGDVGRFPSMTQRSSTTLTLQYREHPGWTMQLHFDNLRAAFKGSDSTIPSYPTIRRYLKSTGNVPPGTTQTRHRRRACRA